MIHLHDIPGSNPRELARLVGEAIRAEIDKGNVLLLGVRSGITINRSNSYDDGIRTFYVFELRTLPYRQLQLSRNWRHVKDDRVGRSAKWRYVGAGETS